MSASGFLLKILFIIFCVLLIIIIIFIFVAIHLYKQVPSDHQRTKDAIEGNGLIFIMKISKAFNLYYEHNNQLPKSLDWCYRLMEYFEEGGLSRENYFSIPQLNQLGPIKYNFAFNKNLSLLSKKDLPGNLVLVFEADGRLNLSGGLELLEYERAKDKYFPAEDRYIYILFLDGTIAKYRLFDGAIALAKKAVYSVSDYSNFGYTYKEEEAFTEYYKKDETPYSPLKWK